MSEVKVFRITGRIIKPNFKTKFQKEMRAVKPEDAIEEIYKLFGSRHRIKRFHIIIEKVEVVDNPDEIKDPVVRALTIGE